MYITLMSVLLGGNGKDRKVLSRVSSSGVVDEDDVDPLIAFDDAYCVDFLLKTWYTTTIKNRSHLKGGK